MATAPRTSRNTMASELQPSRWPSAMPVIRPSSAVQRSAKPSQSNGGMTLGTGRVGMKTMPMTAAMTQKGSEMKKTFAPREVLDHQAAQGRPDRGREDDAQPRNTPIAMPRRSGGNTVKIVAMTSGWADAGAEAPAGRGQRSAHPRSAPSRPSVRPTEKKNTAPTKVRRSPSTPSARALISMPAVIVAM